MPAGETRLAAVARVLGHRFHHPDLLLQACTHASHCGGDADLSQRLAEANERLEFLGDALLGAAIARMLYERHPDKPEGDLTLYRMRLVSRHGLAKAIRSTGLLEHCRVGSFGPTAQGGQWPDKVLANLAEAILGAIYLDGGWEAMQVATEHLLGSAMDSQHLVEPAQDAKSRLQEHCHQRFGQAPTYDTARTGGPDHAPEFASVVRVADHDATGTGGSRRTAETAAAQALLDRLQDADHE